MTASTLSRLPLLAGSAMATGFGRAGSWTFARYMRAPLASTGVLALVTLSALAASNALYFQTKRHPAPFFAQPVQTAVLLPETETAPVVPLQRSAVAQPVPAALPEVAPVTTGAVPAQTPVVPDQPVGNTQAFEVQKKLAELGLFGGKVDGFYGPMTARAIRAFEERNGLEPTGALTPAVVDAILRSDAAGRMPQAAVAMPAPLEAAPVTTAAIPAPMAAPAVEQPQADRVVQRLPALSPVDQAVDTIGNAAANTIDSIVAAVDGGRSATPPTPRAALPMAPVRPTVQVASLAPSPLPPAEVTVPEAVQQTAAAQAGTPANPANNVQLVSQIQRGLASLGFYHGVIDGHPGDATAKAIREFENFYRYEITGQVNPDLVGLLQQAGATI